jgi:homospermidine synthase
MSYFLSQHLEPGSVLIDLAWNIGANDIIGWCHDRNVLYVNTSVEQWDSVGEIFTKTPYEKSLYFRQMKLSDMSRGWKDAATAVVDHGANPGLISHFTKQGLLDIAHKSIEDRIYPKDALEKIVQYAATEDFARLAMYLGVKVIHCSERDTQIASKPKEVNEFIGTWSIEGLREEGTAPAEMGWGTHERELPPNAIVPQHGPKNQIILPQMGINTWVRSWVPDYDIVGMVIRHGEAFGISDKLTVNDKEGNPIYRPTVHYAYMPCDDTIASLHELRARNYELQPKLRIMNEEIISGEDILGALIMGHNYNSWWTGSILDIHESRSLAPGQNATTIQVALGVVSAAMWAIENPRKGLCLPDDLPHGYVLKIAKPYLGKFVSQPYDWTPLKNRKVYFKENPANRDDPTDPWQFRNFLFPM